MSTNAATEMKKHANAAIDMVMAEYGDQLRANGIQLDFSEQTVGIAESILGSLHSEGDNDAELIQTVSIMFGAYIGEVICKQIPQAQWTEDARGARYIQIGSSEVSPVAWCYKRLVNGPQDNVVEKYMTFRRQIAAVV